jgi:hypothetical protein
VNVRKERIVERLEYLLKDVTLEEADQIGYHIPLRVPVAAGGSARERGVENRKYFEFMQSLRYLWTDDDIWEICDLFHKL